MTDWTSWDLKIKTHPNYHALWYNLKTFRLGKPTKLEYGKNEFYDIGIGTKCSNGHCKMCYVKAKPTGEYFDNIDSTWKKWMDTLEINDRPFQVAIGSIGEPTEHPTFTKLIKVIHEYGVVPNYTTNGVLLSNNNSLLYETEKYCAGVALSCNDHLKRFWTKALERLTDVDIYINLHVIISDKDSVDRFKNLYNEYSNIKYFVLLPLIQDNKIAMDKSTFKYLESYVLSIPNDKIAFGARMYDYLKESSIDLCLYDPESFSANALLQKDKVIITPSSFDLNPVKIINL
jgi:hypothetical protein